MNTYLEFYKNAMESGHMNGSPGLCAAFGSFDRRLNLIEPSADERDELECDDLSTWYWASSLRYDDPDRAGAFTPLRQTIVLLMANLNDDEI